MTPQEKDLTTILLDRLNMTEGQKDPEAEALIRRATAERHGTPYYLVQTVLIQDLSLAQCAESDHWFRNAANRDKVHVAWRSKLSRRSNGTSRSRFRISGGQRVPALRSDDCGRHRRRGAGLRGHSVDVRTTRRRHHNR